MVAKAYLDDFCCFDGLTLDLAKAIAKVYSIQVSINDMQNHLASNWELADLYRYKSDKYWKNEKSICSKDICSLIQQKKL